MWTLWVNGQDWSLPHPQTCRSGAKGKIRTSRLDEKDGCTSPQNIGSVPGMSSQNSIWALWRQNPFTLRLLESDVIRKRSCVGWRGAIGKVLAMVTRWSPTLLSCMVLKTSGVGDCSAELNYTPNDCYRKLPYRAHIGKRNVELMRRRDVSFKHPWCYCINSKRSPTFFRTGEWKKVGEFDRASEFAELSADKQILSRDRSH